MEMKLIKWLLKAFLAMTGIFLIIFVGGPLLFELAVVIVSDGLILAWKVFEGLTMLILQ